MTAKPEEALKEDLNVMLHRVFYCMSRTHGKHDRCNRRACLRERLSMIHRVNIDPIWARNEKCFLDVFAGKCSRGASSVWPATARMRDADCLQTVDERRQGRSGVSLCVCCDALQHGALPHELIKAWLHTPVRNFHSAAEQGVKRLSISNMLGLPPPSSLNLHVDPRLFVFSCHWKEQSPSNEFYSVLVNCVWSQQVEAKPDRALFILWSLPIVFFPPQVLCVVDLL